MKKLLVKCSTERLYHWLEVIEEIIDARKDKKKAK